LRNLHYRPSPSCHHYPFSFYPPSRRPPCPTPFPYTTLFRSRSSTRYHRRDRTPCRSRRGSAVRRSRRIRRAFRPRARSPSRCRRSEEHTSELPSRFPLVCRLLLETKKLPATCQLDKLHDDIL